MTFIDKNIYIVHEINFWSYTQGADLMLGNSLFGFVELTKNVDVGKHSSSRYGIGFDVRRSLLSDSSEFGRKVIIFDADMNSPVHIDNKKKDILIRNKGPTDSLCDTNLIAGKEYSINFTEQQKKFCLGLHYNRVSIYIFNSNSVEI